MYSIYRERVSLHQLKGINSKVTTLFLLFLRAQLRCTKARVFEPPVTRTAMRGAVDISAMKSAPPSHKKKYLHSYVSKKKKKKKKRRRRRRRSSSPTFFVALFQRQHGLKQAFAEI
tara:strand:- start:105 stop:452 length:348 start_codon:yes stop_codon:yes gene_type:complete